MVIIATPNVTGSSGASAPARVPSQTLDQSDFLKLLITQMRSQDPLSPMKDLDFMQQMTQFTMLEQFKGMQSDLSRLRSDQQTLQANSLLGRTVEIAVDAETNLVGPVTAVQFEAGTPKLVVGGQSYELSRLLSITPTPTP